MNADPAPGLSGRRLVATIAVLAFPVGRAAIPLLVAAFVVLEVVTVVTGHAFGTGAVLAAPAAFYGMSILAFRLSLAG